MARAAIDVMVNGKWLGAFHKGEVGYELVTGYIEQSNRLRQLEQTVQDIQGVLSRPMPASGYSVRQLSEEYARIAEIVEGVRAGSAPAMHDEYAICHDGAPRLDGSLQTIRVRCAPGSTLEHAEQVLASYQQRRGRHDYWIEVQRCGEWTAVRSE